MKNCKVRKLYTIIAPVLVFVTLLFSCPLFVHASDDNQSNGHPLPFTPAMSPLDDYVISSGELQALQSCLTELGSSYDLSSDNCIIFKGKEGRWYDWSTYIDVPCYTVYFLDNTLSSAYWGTNKNFINFNLFTSGDYIDWNMPAGHKYFFARSSIGNLQNGSWYGMYDGSTVNVVKRFYGDTTSGTVSNIIFEFTYYDYYPIYCNGNFETIDSNSFRGIFLTSDVTVTPADPTPTDPNDPDPITPDIPSPVFPDFPSSPTVENLLEWVGNCIKAIGTWLAGFGAWLKGALNKIITNIVNGFKSVIDNFKSLFKPFIDKVLEFFNDFSTTFENFVSDIKSLVTDIKTALTNVKKFFDTIIDLGTTNGVFSLVTLFSALFIPTQSQMSDMFQASDTFALATAGITIWNKIFEIWNTVKGLEAIKILHVPSITYHGVTIGGFDIDFSWYQQFKSYGDGIISAFLYFSYFWFLVFRLPTFIRGQSAIFSDAVTTADTVQEPSHFKGKIGF